jgi:hypothetical protein
VGILWSQAAKGVALTSYSKDLTLSNFDLKHEEDLPNRTGVKFQFIFILKLQKNETPIFIKFEYIQGLALAIYS